MKNKLKNWYVIICMLIITAGFVVSSYLQYFPIHIVDVHTPFKVLTPKVKSGEIMIYLLDYCLYKSYPITVSRTLVDGTIIELPTTREVLELGCHKVQMQVPVPVGALPGMYHLTGIKTFAISQTRKEDVHFLTETFEITK